MNETDQDQLFPDPIGQRLKAAREAKGLSLDDIARQTRIPIRHLQHIENGEWDALPATTYSVGFARSYANAIGMDGSAIGAEVREHLGATPAHATAMTSYYEPADPARVPPRSLALVAGAIALLLILGYALWRSGAVDDSAVDQGEIASVDTVLPDAEPVTPPANQALGGPTAGASTGPVTLTATDDVWLRVYEGAGGTRLFENTLKAGERFVIPSNAQQPQILTGRPDALRVTVGTTEIPQLGPAERTIADVSLRAEDLLARVQGAQPVAAPAPAR